MKMTPSGNLSQGESIVVVEYPKSGGTWLVSMIACGLNLPRRDIYISEDETQNAYDANKHPWYEGAETLKMPSSCVIKSHELPESPRHRIHAKFVHLIRDGRDVIVSKYYFEKDFCVKNGIFDSFDISFDDYVEKISKEWTNYVAKWLQLNIVTCKYESILIDTFMSLKKIYNELSVPISDSDLYRAIESYSIQNMKNELGKTYKYNTFVRKATSGDWANHFSKKNIQTFKENAGEMLVSLGYENNNNW